MSESRNFAGMNIFDGLATRKGNGSVKITVDQLDINGQELPEYVNNQSHVLAFKGDSVKHKGAFLGAHNLVAIVENRPTNETSERQLPYKRMKITQNMDVSALPDYVRRTEKDGYIVNYNYKIEKEENVYIKEEDRWILVQKDVPVYLQTLNSKGKTLAEKDFKKTHSAYHTYPLHKLAFVNAVEVKDNKVVADSKGVYLILADINTDITFFNMPSTGSYGAKLAISSFMGIFAHETAGIIQSGELVNNKFPEGTSEIGTKAVTEIRVVLADGTLSDTQQLSSYRVYPFNKKLRRSTVASNSDVEVAKQVEVAKVNATAADNFDL